MKKIKIGHKTAPRQTFNDGVKGIAAPKFAIVPISSGEGTGSDAFKSVAARHERQYDEAGNTQKVSGNKKLLAEKLGAPSGYQLESYMVPDGKRGSVSTEKAFAKYAKKAQSGE